jgi:CobQ-like glutamine amidotransferase family enzyme
MSIRDSALSIAVLHPELLGTYGDGGNVVVLQRRLQWRGIPVDLIPVPLDTSSMQQIAQLSGGDFHTAASAEELKSVYAQLGEQIGYEIKQQDVSRPWMIAGTLLVMLGAAGALVVGGRIP